MLLNTTTPGATTPSFATQATFVVGNDPESVAIGDLNGDGKPDIAVANYNYHGNGSISVLLNTTTPGATTPSFAAQVSFAVGNDPESVAIGDLNGDGRPDLAVANNGSNTVSLLLNATPPGATLPTFAAPVDFATGVRPFAVAVADLNGDGKPDLAIINDYEGMGGNSVSVLLNATAPGAVLPAFAPKVDFATGTEPGSVVVGDLNGDSRPDLAVTNDANNDLSVLLNTPATITQAAAVGTIIESDSPPSPATLPPAVSVAFGPFGEVLEIVNSAGALTQVDATGAHQLSQFGVRDASIAFAAGREVLLLTYTDGSLYQFDAAGAAPHQRRRRPGCQRRLRPRRRSAGNRGFDGPADAV